MTRKCVQMTRKELLLFIVQVYLNVLSCSKNGFLKKGEIGHLYQFNAQFSFRSQILYKEIWYVVSIFFIMLYLSFLILQYLSFCINLYVCDTSSIFFVIQRPFVKVHHIYSFFFFLRPIAFIFEFGTEFLKGVKLFNYCQKTTAKIPQSANSLFCDRKTSKADQNRKRQVGTQREGQTMAQVLDWLCVGIFMEVSPFKKKCPKFCCLQ